MSERATCWSVTINNPTDSDKECIDRARQRSGWKVDGQLEKGQEGTLHYQLKVNTPQVRFSALKKAFPRGHIEPARNAAALDVYVHKEESRVAALPESTDKFPSLTKLWWLIYSEISDEYVGPAEDVVHDLTDKKKLLIFDNAISSLIAKGYHVETMGVNPQIRSSFTKYARPLMLRAISLADKDRQTAALVAEDVSVPVYTNAPSEDCTS